MVITKINQKPSNLVVEVNGVFHYSRNSEQSLGKDILKIKALQKLGYDCACVPYYDWAILENSQKK